jgi:hypothetical protein
MVFHPNGCHGNLCRLVFFARRTAVMVPVSILAISDLLLPAYNSIPVLIATYAVMIVPVWFGRSQRGEHPRWLAASRWMLFGLYQRRCFTWYRTSPSGRFKVTMRNHCLDWPCYWAAVPFYRWMLTGDIFYLTVLLGCLAIAGVTNPGSWIRKNSVAVESV